MNLTEFVAAWKAGTIDADAFALHPVDYDAMRDGLSPSMLDELRSAFEIRISEHIVQGQIVAFKKRGEGEWLSFPPPRFPSNPADPNRFARSFPWRFDPR